MRDGETLLLVRWSLGARRCDSDVTPGVTIYMIYNELDLMLVDRAIIFWGLVIATKGLKYVFTSCTCTLMNAKHLIRVMILMVSLFWNCRTQQKTKKSLKEVQYGFVLVRVLLVICPRCNGGLYISSTPL